MVEGATKTKRYAYNTGADLPVSVGDEVKAGAVLATESRNYSLVEVHDADGNVVHTRGEIQRADGTWIQRGSESNLRGKTAEKAANDEIAEEMAQKFEFGELSGGFQVDLRNGSGGFDGARVLNDNYSAPSATARTPHR